MVHHKEATIIFSWILIYTFYIVSGSPPMYNQDYLEDDCRHNRTLDLTEALYGNWSTYLVLYGDIRQTRIDAYKPNMNCSITVYAPVGYYLTVRIKRIETYRESGSSDSCNPDYLEVAGSTSTRRFCGHGTPSYSLTSTTRQLTFRFFSGNWTFENNRIGFDLYYTAFHREKCGSHEFKCKLEGRCIPSEVKCDRSDNCGDWSDERRGACGLSTGATIAITLICVLVFGSCLGFFVYFYYDTKKNAAKQRRREAAVRARMTSTGEPQVTISDTSNSNGQSPTAPDNNNYPPTAPNNNSYPPGAEPPPPYTFAAAAYSSEEKPPLDESQAVSVGSWVGGIDNPAYSTPQGAADESGAVGGAPPPYHLAFQGQGQSERQAPPSIQDDTDDVTIAPRSAAIVTSSSASTLTFSDDSTLMSSESHSMTSRSSSAVTRMTSSSFTNESSASLTPVEDATRRNEGDRNVRN